MPLPSQENIERSRHIGKDLELDQVDGGVNEAFKLWPQHCDLSRVKAKIGVLNALWMAGVLDVSRWASRIVEVDHNSNLVEEMADFKTSKQWKRRRLSVPASKYCRFSSPALFPIWDSVAVSAVRRLIAAQNGGIREPQALGFTKDELTEYQGWKKAVDRLRQICTPHCSYKDIDEYVWLLGFAFDLQDTGGAPTSPWSPIPQARHADWRSLLPGE